MVYIKSMRDIKELRNVLHLTQKELAQKLDVHVLTVSRWERGIRKPQAKYERKLEQLLKKRMGYLAKIFPIGLDGKGRVDVVQLLGNQEKTK